MWSINGALALWLGYWVFLGWVVWSYEKRNRALKAENERLKRTVASGVGRAAKRVSAGSISGENCGNILRGQNGFKGARSNENRVEK